LTIVQFEKIGDSEIVHRGYSIPPPNDDQYKYKPKPIEHEPPISMHEFYYRFHACHDRCLASRFSIFRPMHKCRRPYSHARGAVEKIPKKTLRVEEEGDCRSFFWGLCAVEKLSFYMVAIYHALVILSCLLFWFLWLFPWGHSSDLQNASVPLLAALGLIQLFWWSFEKSYPILFQDPK
jgi:hypothetical protein